MHHVIRWRGGPAASAGWSTPRPTSPTRPCSAPTATHPRMSRLWSGTSTSTPRSCLAVSPRRGCSTSDATTASCCGDCRPTGTGWAWIRPTWPASDTTTVTSSTTCRMGQISTSAPSTSSPPRTPWPTSAESVVRWSRPPRHSGRPASYGWRSTTLTPPCRRDSGIPSITSTSSSGRWPPCSAFSRSWASPSSTPRVSPCTAV
jgi:hypothetical protein